jgi:hypothetical protein
LAEWLINAMNEASTESDAGFAKSASFEGFRLEDFSNRADVANAALKRTRGKAKKAVRNTV